MRGVWVSSSGVKNMTVYKIGGHWQAMIPYPVMPPVEEPVPPVVYPVNLTAPTIDSKYEYSIVENGVEKQGPVIDKVYTFKINEGYKREFYGPVIDDQYYWEFIPIEKIIIDSEGIGLAEEYKFVD